MGLNRLRFTNGKIAFVARTHGIYVMNEENIKVVKLIKRIVANLNFKGSTILYKWKRKSNGNILIQSSDNIQFKN